MTYSSADELSNAEFHCSILFIYLFTFLFIYLFFRSLVDEVLFCIFI